MASSTNAVMAPTQTSCTNEPVKALFFKPQNMIIFIPATTTSSTTEGTTAETCLLLVGPISVRTETRELDLSKLGQAVYLETIDRDTLQLTVSGIPRALEGMHREWFAKCKTFAERFQHYVVDFQVGILGCEEGAVGVEVDFEGSG